MHERSLRQRDTVYDAAPRSLVSIVITNHNYGRFLDDAIQSALEQSYDCIEVIVVDDGSTDNSRAIISRYHDRVTPVFQAWAGQFAAFNAGVARSHGEIVMFLDADDLFLPHVVAEVARAFRENPRISKVQYRLEVIDANGVVTGDFVPSGALRLPSGDLRRHMLRFPDDVRTPPTSGNAFSASVLRQILPIPDIPHFRTGAELYLVNVAPLFGPVYSLPSVGGRYRRHGANAYDSTALNLDRIHAMIRRTAFNREYIRRHANRLALPSTPRRNDDILSVTYVASRMAACRLDCPSRRLPGDSRLRLARLGLVASARRFDLPCHIRALFMAWFIAVSVVPRPLARWLLTQAFFPEQRRAIAKLVR
jgi:GT2 family glycosyltransferase